MDHLIPKYRVRLFLSVDLSGSTAFKNTKENPVDWVPKFRDFYSSFSDIFSGKFDAFCSQHDRMCAEFRGEQPRIWKTIGDEVIFVNRVKSSAQIISYVHAFIQALEAYSIKLKTDTDTERLDVKGNGWLASFPYPNQTISIRNTDQDLVTEEIELDADEKPHEYEFLGSGIDSGFRISKNSTPSFFTISPSLALKLCLPAQNKDTVGKLGQFQLRFSGMNQLKGVIDGEDFPIIGIDTERNSGRAELHEKLGKLTQDSVVDQDLLKDYLLMFEKFHSVNSPALKLEETSVDVEEPHFYTKKFLPSWRKEYEKNEATRASIDESSQVESGDTVPEADVEAVSKELDNRS